MLTIDLARRLHAAGLRWDPSPGDRFVLPDRGMDEDVFVISDMTVEVHEFPTATVIGFNGTTEWALDSVEQREALWLPLEHQLRDLLGGLFRSLAHDPDGAEAPDTSDGGAGPWAVTLSVPDTSAPDGGRRTHVVRGASAEQAYGLALAEVLEDLGTRV